MRTFLLLSTATIGVLSVPAYGQDQSGVVASGDTGIRLQLSGQVNRGVLFTDDGEQTDTFFVDNDNSSTRLRFTGEGDLNDRTTVGVNIEVQIESNSTASVNQLDETSGGDSFTERKLEVYLDNQAWGRLTLGQGSTASDGTSEEDLSGTAVVGYSGVADLAGGILFRGTDGVLSDVNVGSVFANFDGLSRRDRIRYDTPGFAGFSLSASAASDDQYDVALRYANEFGGVAVASAIAFSSDDESNETTNGSLSLLHVNSGVSLTLAAAQTDLSDTTDTRDPTFGYVKLGYQTNGLTSLGKTAFAVDYSLNEDTGVLGDEATSYGLFAVQSIDRVGTDLYLGVRNYEYEQPGAEFEDISAVLTGARIKF